jgi:hypothetical protein
MESCTKMVAIALDSPRDEHWVSGLNNNTLWAFAHVVSNKNNIWSKYPPFKVSISSLSEIQSSFLQESETWV